MEKNNDLFGGRSEAERMKNVANQVHDIVNAIPEIPQLETSDDEVQVETTESPEENPVVSVRANKIGIPCLQGINNKKDTLIDYCQKYNIDLKNVAYVGNDLNDKDAMEIVGITFCPEDAHKSIKAISNHILNTKGGNGVIRELLDFIIKQKGE